MRAIKLVANDNKERERRAYNVVVYGIPSNESDPGHDATTVKKFLSSTCDEVIVVKKVQRLHHAKPKEHNSMSQCKQTTSAVLVALSSPEEQQKVLRAVRHHTLSEFEGVFAHEDRTQA